MEVSAGKSTIINALCSDFVAEVGVLPTTDNITVYQCFIEGRDALHLIDLPGIDGAEESRQQLLEQLVNCDIVLWVVKASQPAKSLDCELKSRRRLVGFHLRSMR